ncbi:Glycine/D-amino acid oxidase [Tistlia consotensis]|uniref:Glycine/D-amino acid oxidase n=1 Tax=Tistlia consotensis USBA 355 TaxID=560819 RepID=A0A1Y6C099_9PROT|nr:FAD-dependent oxidoreductase [Tistlia consotensis]SMF38889.1 Glycine/D-amino acid oxidase [Tistlia consotensis USBA 355]SNR36749.1 Glycine/D-amino acid oxidase [Tistlia consotensis]
MSGAGSEGRTWDAAVIGGGIMGAATAIRLGLGGLRVVLLEAGALGMGASGVNAGTLSLQIKRARLMPYALRGHALWRAAGERVGFHQTGGLTLAFTEQEAAVLTERMTERREAGAPIELIAPGRVRALAPRLSDRVLLASWCPVDGYANSSLTGSYYRAALREAGVELREGRRVERVVREARGYRLEAPGASLSARRLVLAAGAWSGRLAAGLGCPLPVHARVNTVSVTTRMPRLVDCIVGHATGLLTLKQSDNGSVLIGGGWQGRGDPDRGPGAVVAESLLTNLRLAQYALPDLARARLLRSWTGYEAHVPDFYPLAGALPGLEEAYVLACVRGGYTIGPYIGRLLGDLILGREPELPLFDPGRFAAPETRSRREEEERVDGDERPIG